MNLLLAVGEVDNNALFLGMLVIGLTALVNLALGLKQMFQRTPPIESEFATKKELQDHIDSDSREHDNIFKKLGGSERGWRDKLEEVSGKVSALDERSKNTESSVRVIGEDIKDLIREVRSK